jgi:hypothetical protein
MGVQIPNTLAGQTTGTIVTVDYTADFTALNTSLGTINTTLTAINTNLTAVNTNLVSLTAAIELSIGATGAVVPGSVAYSSDAAVGWIAGVSETLGKMWDQQGKLVSAVGQVQMATSSLGSAMQESVAVQQIVAADQMSTNEFNKSATKEALARNGITPPAPRPITEVISEKINEATSINLATSATGFISDKLTRGLELAGTFASNLFVQSFTGSYVSRKWTAFTDYLTDVTAGIDKAELEAQKALSKATSAKRAKV